MKQTTRSTWHDPVYQQPSHRIKRARTKEKVSARLGEASVRGSRFRCYGHTTWRSLCVCLRCPGKKNVPNREARNGVPERSEQALSERRLVTTIACRCSTRTTVPAGPCATRAHGLPPRPRSPCALSILSLGLWLQKEPRLIVGVGRRVVLGELERESVSRVLVNGQSRTSLGDEVEHLAVDLATAVLVFFSSLPTHTSQKPSSKCTIMVEPTSASLASMSFSAGGRHLDDLHMPGGMRSGASRPPSTSRASSVVVVTHAEDMTRLIADPH
jgi:hypothetical protein